MNNSNIRVIFGLKLRQIRQQRGESLQSFSREVGLSPSYLNEIENGKKYPKVEKIVQIAETLGLSYDDLVSQKLDNELNFLEEFLESSALRKFPFHLFGITIQDVVGLLPDAPKEGRALVKALLDTTRSYDMRVEDFFHTALRCFQEMHLNYFEDIEQAVDEYRKSKGWARAESITSQKLYDSLLEDFGVTVDEIRLSKTKHLAGVRSVLLEGPVQTLLINDKFSETQKAFMAAREIGSRVLELEERGHVSPDIEVESFEQVVNAFKASYFASALFMNKDRLVDDLGVFLKQKTWQPDGFAELVKQYRVTPEMFFYRLSEILPRFFGVKLIHFMRVDKSVESDRFQLVKQLNMSGVRIPTGIVLNERFCRRWQSLSIIDRLAREGAGENGFIVGTQRSEFIDSDKEYFCICIARPLVLAAGGLSSITLGFQADESFKKTFKFWKDPAIPDVKIGETCERCSMTKAECSLRAAPPVIYAREQDIEMQRAELEALLDSSTLSKSK